MVKFAYVRMNRCLEAENMSEPKFLIDVNPELVWDYEIPLQHEQTDAFRRWYIARVLARGRITDLETIGIEAIYHYWPTLQLPKPIHQFWQWYLTLPEIQQRYGNLDSISARSA